MRALLSSSPAAGRVIHREIQVFQIFGSKSILPILDGAGTLPKTEAASILRRQLRSERLDVGGLFLPRRIIRMPPCSFKAAHQFLPLARRVYDHPGLIINPITHMAWRPYENLISGELNNCTPGKVTGWMHFFRSGKQPLKVSLDLVGDFHEDIRGRVIRLSNPEPMDRNTSLDRRGTYMEGFGSVQCGEAGDTTAGISLGFWTESLSQKLLAQQEILWEQNGVPASEREKRRQEIASTHRRCIKRQELYYPYVAYPYIEWYSDANGRVVLELAPDQVEIVDGRPHSGEKAAEALAADERRRATALCAFLGSLVGGPTWESSRKFPATPSLNKVN